MTTTEITLIELRTKFKNRLARYQEKLARASGTDIINQGAKIKTLRECIQDVRIQLEKLNKTQ